MWNAVTLIVIISVVMWILSSLFSAKDEEKPEAARRGNGRGPGQRPRSSSGDIDRFLEEMNRRRRQAPERPRRETPAAARPEPRPVRTKPPVPPTPPAARP